MRTTVDLPGDLMKRVKIAAVERGSTLRDLIAEALRQSLADQAHVSRKKLSEATIKLPQGHTRPIHSNREIAQMFEREDVAILNAVYRGR